MPEMMYVQGPMHPDLFDGETPIMIPVPVEEALDIYHVEVEYTVTDTEEYMVLAANEDEAEDYAKEKFTDEHNMFDLEIEWCNAVKADDGVRASIDITETMIDQYKQYKGVT